MWLGLTPRRVHTCGQRWFETEGRGNVHCSQQLFDRRDVNKKKDEKTKKNKLTMMMLHNKINAELMTEAITAI